MLGTGMESVHMWSVLKKTTSKAILYSRKIQPYIDYFVRVCKGTRKLQLYERTETPTTWCLSPFQTCYIYANALAGSLLCEVLPAQCSIRLLLTLSKFQTLIYLCVLLNALFL